MIKSLIARIRQGHRTLGYPAAVPALPDRFRGLPVLGEAPCPDGCRACAEACPTGAISGAGEGLSLDLGRCLFCPDCQSACPEGVIAFTGDHRMSARSREDLVVTRERTVELARALDAKSRKLFGRSLKLRQVSAGGCNACEADLNVLGTVIFDMGRFGIQFVASPRHADGLLITGPVTQSMRTALMKTYEATPAPKLVIAVGSCAVSGGPYVGHPEASDGASALLPVDLVIPGCPPHPLTTLDGLLRLLGRVEGEGR